MSHASAVHGFWSSQFLAAPLTHAPLAQTSESVHASPSSHATLLTACWQPLLLSHESSVHTVLSAHVASLGKPAHALFSQRSFNVHDTPSSQTAVLALWVQLPSVLPSQASSVHGLLSAQSLGAPGLHVPLAQTSPIVQPLPSLQPPPSLACA